MPTVRCQTSSSGLDQADMDALTIRVKTSAVLIRFISGGYAPSVTLKWPSGLAALESGKVNPERPHLPVAGRPLGNASPLLEPKVHGP